MEDNKFKAYMTILPTVLYAADLWKLWQKNERFQVDNHEIRDMTVWQRNLENVFHHSTGLTPAQKVYVMEIIDMMALHRTMCQLLRPLRAYDQGLLCAYDDLYANSEIPYLRLQSH